MTPSGNGDEPLKSMAVNWLRTSSGRWGRSSEVFGVDKWTACWIMHGDRETFSRKRAAAISD